MQYHQTWNAQSATVTDIKLMGQHLRHIFCTYQLFHESVQWSQKPLLQKRCSTELVTDMTKWKWQISLIVLIIPYFGGHLSLLVARSFQIGSSLTLTILHLICPLMAKQHTKTAWPIILFNYNLPPKEQFLKKNHISVGIIPGPKKPGDLDSFLWLLVQEFLQLELGVSAFDAITMAVFLLHAYLIVVFGNIPAVSMIMHMKGHNGRSPCCMCEIQGICIPFSDWHG